MTLPEFAAESIDPSVVIVALYVAPVVGSVYAFVVLLLTGLIRPHPCVAQPFWVSGTIGIVFQLFGVGLYGLFSIVCTLASPPQWLVTAGFISGAIVVFFTGIAVPFGLLRWRASEVTSNLTAHRRSVWPKRLTILGLCMIVFFVARWAAVRAFDGDCRQVAAWVKKTHPSAGNYPAIPLPNSQRLLSGDGTIDATVLPDGRAVLVLRMFVDDSENGHWSEIIYASSPIASVEIGKDSSGRTHILIDGLSEHVIKEQVDARHFIAVSPKMFEGW
jgi:hypothetical protein